MEIEFKEEQRFTQWWLWLILIAIGSVPALGIYKQLILKENFGNDPMSNSNLVVMAVLIFGLIALFWFMRLKTTINSQEIEMHFFPFFKKNVQWERVKSIQVVNYGFIGGWGIRLWTKYGTIYNVKGNKGLAIELHDGKRFVIGTQQEIKLKQLLEKIK